MIDTNAPLKGVVIMTLGSTSLWSGRARLVVDDFGASAADLPPAAVASLGSKRLFPREKLKPLEAVKRRMKRALASRGTRFVSGYAIAKEDVGDVLAELDALKAEGNRLKDELLNHFEATVKKWHETNPEWKHILAAGTPEKEYVRNRIQFGWDAFMVDYPENEGLAEKLRTSVGQMGPNLYREIVAEAKEFFAKSLAVTRNVATQRTVTPLRRMAQKLYRLGMLDYLARPIGQVCLAVLDTLPSKGKVTDGDFLKLIRLANFLQHVDEMRAVGQRVVDGLSVEEAAREVMGVEALSGVATTSAGESSRPAASLTASIFDDGDALPVHVVTPSIAAAVDADPDGDDELAVVVPTPGRRPGAVAVIDF